MSRATRRALFIVASVLGATLILPFFYYRSTGYFSDDSVQFIWKIYLVVNLFIAIIGLIAMFRCRDARRIRILSSVLALLSLTTNAIGIIYNYLSYGMASGSSDEKQAIAFEMFRFELGFSQASSYVATWEKWEELAATIALVLWILCAATPGKKGSNQGLSETVESLPGPMPSISIQSFYQPPQNSTQLAPAQSVTGSNQSAKYCKNCGKSLVGLGKFCVECGSPA